MIDGFLLEFSKPVFVSLFAIDEGPAYLVLKVQALRFAHVLRWQSFRCLARLEEFFRLVNLRLNQFNRSFGICELGEGN